MIGKPTRTTRSHFFFSLSIESNLHFLKDYNAFEIFRSGLKLFDEMKDILTDICDLLQYT